MAKITKSLPISVCILCKNEEDRLKKCLDGLEVFQEVLVMDTGSIDRSIEIIQSYAHVTLLREEWKGFALSRRSLFEKATQPWILWLDADEVVSPELLHELEKCMLQEIECDAFEINRMVYFEKQWVKHGLWFPNWNVRLFRQGSWNMPQREVHESIEIRGSTKRLQGLIYHYTYRNWDDQKQRSMKYSALWAKQKKNEGRKSSFGQALIHSVWTFFRSYLLKKGCLDGLLGLKIALAVAQEVYAKHILLCQLYALKGPNP